MADNATLAIIENTVHTHLPDARIILFGSHARGDFDNSSDYDLIVVTPQKLAKAAWLYNSDRIHKDLINAIHAPFDLLFYSEEEINIKKELPGHIVKTALEESLCL
jgi:predicted nucleotidyltransferase